MERRGTKSVFRRLFIMLLVMVVVVYLILTTMFVNYVLQQRELVNKSHTSSVESSTTVMSQQLKAVHNVELQYFNDVRVSRLAHGLYADKYERVVLILDLIQSIQSTQSINGIISDIEILFPQEQIELSALRGYHKRSFDAAAFAEERSKLTDPLVMRDGEVEMSISYPIPFADAEDYLPDYMVRIILSQDFMNEVVDHFRTSSQTGAFWVLCSDSGELSGIGLNPERADMMQTWADSWMASGKSDFMTQKVTAAGGNYWLVSNVVGSYNLMLVTYKTAVAAAWELGGQMQIIGLTMLAMGALFGLFILRADKTVTKPIHRIMEAFRKVSDGDLEVRLSHQSNDEFGYIYDSFNDTIERIEDLIRDSSEQKILLQKAELIQLQSQINPHFLYNSFYNLKFMAQNEDYEQIQCFVTALAGYYRFLNKETQLDVELQSEVSHMENYIEIQQMRFGDKITVEKDTLPEELHHLRVPKLILQPIIENAYNYGLRDTLSGGLLTIRYRVAGEMLHVVISDNGSSMTEEKLAAMVKQMHTFEEHSINHALTNIQRRLELAYGEKCGLELAIGENGGLQVTMKLSITAQSGDLMAK